jgi:hypothetical protein
MVLLSGIRWLTLQPAIIIIHEIEHEGIPALDAADLDSRRQEHSWRTFFNAAIHGTTLSLVYLTGVCTLLQLRSA